MKFSVVIPLYNKEEHIKECIQSVLSQSYDNFEIIVINDGSTDRSVDIVHEFESDKISVYDQKNQGVSVARNNGVEKANNEYILFLDADDGLMPEYISKMSTLINDNPNSGLWATNKYNYKGNFNLFIKRETDFLPKISQIDNYFKLVLEHQPILGPVYVVKRKVFLESGGFVPGMKRGQDTYLLSVILMKEKLVFLNEYLYYYRLDAENMATQVYRPPNTTISLLDHIGVYNKYVDIYIIDYSVDQVVKYIESGYKNYASLWLEKIESRTPEKYSYLIDKKRLIIEKKLNTPFIYIKLKKRLVRSMVLLKDVIFYVILRKTTTNKFHSGSLKL